MASVFAAALELPAERRRAFLEDRLADDPTLRTEIESLLAADAETSRFLEIPALDAWAELWRDYSPASSTQEGERIGPYRILRTIGQGGMGTVCLAVRADDEYEKRVAIKLALRTATDDLVRRFRAERQILADLEHPNIARLLDGGTTQAGLPYLVMEHVEGTAIDQYCDERELTADECLALFQRVCDAVQYAHRNLVVHRDLKPGNILVTEEGVPKLLDFGIAKLLAPEPGAGGDVTLEGLRPLTPNYASPEQLRGQPVSTASDVYSLGVLLYRLVTGRLPRLFRALTPHEIDDAMAREPSPPQVDRDFDAVVAKALAVEPERRYASVEQLSADLRRWAAGHPILARPQTLRYRAAKLLRRHLIAAVVTAGVAALLLGFTVDKTRQAERIARERDRARVEAGKARELADFLADLLRDSDPWQAAGREVTVREVLDRGAEEIRRRLDAEPELRGMLLDTMGSIYLRLARFDEARPLLEEGLAERRRALPADHPEVAASLQHLGLLSLRKGEFDEAETFFQQALAIRRGLPEPLPVAESLHGLGQTLYVKGDYAVAESAHREALELRLAALGEDSLEVAASRNELAVLYTELGRYAAADRLFSQALETRRRLVGDDHPEVAVTLDNLASLRRRQHDPEDAEALLREVVAIRRSVFDDAHPQVGQALHNLAGVLVQQGRLEEAEELYREVLDTAPRVLGDEHRDVAVVYYKVGQLRQLQGDLAGAESYYRRSLEIVHGSLPEGHPGAAYPLLGLASLYDRRGEPERAEPLYREALELRLQALPADHPEVAKARAALDDFLVRRGREPEDP